jgi:hypothetical protein
MTPATVGAWLDARTPPPPPALAARLRDVLAPALGDGVARAPDVCLRVAEEMLAEQLASGATSRTSALDLLTIDALVTYAFEALGAHPDTLDARAADAMRRIAAIPHAAPSSSKAAVSAATATVDHARS